MDGDKNSKPGKGVGGFDDLMKEIGETRENVSTLNKTLKSIMAPFNRAASFGKKAMEVGAQVWEDYGRHVWRPIGYVGGKAWNGYKNLFNKVSHVEDKESGQLVFSKKRAAAMVMATMVALTGAFHYNLGIPAAFEVAKDSRVLFGTEQMEVYLNRPEMIEEGVYEVTGCLDYPCSDDNTLYFRIEDNVFKDVGYLFSRGHFYDPEYVAGAMSNEANQCSVEYIGTTSRFLQRTLGWKPQVVQAECTPISIDNLNIDTSIDIDADTAASFNAAAAAYDMDSAQIEVSYADMGTNQTPVHVSADSVTYNVQIPSLKMT